MLQLVTVFQLDDAKSGAKTSGEKKHDDQEVIVLDSGDDDDNDSVILIEDEEPTCSKRNVARSSGRSSEKILERKDDYFAVTKTYRPRMRGLIKDAFARSSAFLKKMGLCLGELRLNQANALDGPDQFGITINETIKKPTSMFRLLYYQELHSISDDAYENLRKNCAVNMPPIKALKRRRAEIDGLFPIEDNDAGVYVSFRKKLRAHLTNFFDKKYGPENKFDKDFNDSIIHVKLGIEAGDQVKSTRLVFAIMNERSEDKETLQNYTLGIFEAEKANYASLSECFKELIDEIEQLNEITIGNKTLKVVYYLGADWKMLSISLGILAANSKFPCVWCKCPKEEFSNYDADWSIVDTNLGARSHEEIAKIHESVAVDKNTVKYGHERKPLFREIIPIKRYMIDMLHLFLRISDTLFNLLIKDCSFADGFDMTAINKFDVTTYKHMNSLEHFLNERCSVRFSFMWIPETKKLTWRDLSDRDKKRLFENFNLAKIIPKHKHFNSLSKLWTEFYQIIEDVKAVKLSQRQVKQRTADWLRLYLTIYNKTTITPYMHAFVSHLHEFVFLYKDINSFGIQEFGRDISDVSTREEALKQSMNLTLKKCNRIEYLRSFVTDTD